MWAAARAVDGAASSNYQKLLPSVHFKWDLSEADRISLSLARSVKRLNFNELIPALLDGEYGDNDYIGNPRLEMETGSPLHLGPQILLNLRHVHDQSSPRVRGDSSTSWYSLPGLKWAAAIPRICSGFLSSAVGAVCFA